MIQRVLITIGLLCIFTTSGCSTMEAVRNAPLDKGVSQVFNADYKRVLKAAKEALVEKGLQGLQIEEVKEISENTWIILGKRGVTMWSWGELVRVVGKKSGHNLTTVWVYTKQRNFAGFKKDFSRPIFSSIETELKLIK